VKPKEKIQHEEEEEEKKVPDHSGR